MSDSVQQKLRERYDRLDERWELTARWQKARRWLPFAFFVGGFLFDVLTLGRVVTTTNLLVVSGYATGAAACLWGVSRELPEKWSRRVTFALQFCLGSLFSALVVVYFRSAGEIFTLLTVGALFGAMVANEFLHRDESQRELVWGIYAVSLVMLLNFVVPHLFESVSAWWFYLSTALGLGVVWGLGRLAKLPKKTLYYPSGAVGVLVALYLFGAIPPVPLVMKNTLVGTAFKKTGGEYTCEVGERSWFARADLVPPTIKWRPGGHVAVLTAIFAPKDVEVDMEHRWHKKVDGEWQQTDTIDFHMRGGREDGWRMWSRKRHITEGLWRVETAVKGGSVLGYETFEVEEVDDEVDEEVAKERRAL